MQEGRWAGTGGLFRAFGLAVLALASTSGVADVQDNYLSFDGVNDAVVIPTSASLALTSRLSVEAWIRPQSISGTKDQNRIVSKGSAVFELTVSTGDTGCGFGTAGHVQWRVVIGGVNARICGGTLVAGNWYHLAGTYDGAQARLYVNGSLVASAARTGAVATGSESLIIGNALALNRPFSGAIEEVRIWGRALTAAEIVAGMNDEIAGQATGLAAYYRFNEPSGQSALDTSPNANPGRLGTTTGSDASDPAWVLSAPPSNQAPVVDAGPGQTIVLPDNDAVLDGTVSDDGLPSGSLITSWSFVSGPGVVSFSNPGLIDTTVTFPAAGTYVLRLSANDGQAAAQDTVTLVVSQSSALAALTVSPSALTLQIGQSLQFTASGTDQGGNPVTVNPAWTSTAGSVSQAGLYLAPQAAGTYQVRATQGSITASATVNVVNAVAWPTNGWQTATPAEMGMNATTLAQARTFAQRKAGSGFITRGGRLVMSWGDPDTRYNVLSTSKSIGGILVGLALQDNLVQLEDRAQWYLPSLGTPPSSNTGTGWLDDITLLQLATHTSGFEKASGYGSVIFAPGTTWSYSDGGANWLSDTLTVTYAQDLRNVLNARVLTPLGITGADFYWRDHASRDTTINGIARREFGSGMSVNVDAMARLGYLYLRQGVWEGTRILPQSHVNQAGKPAPAAVGLPVNQPASYPGASAHYGVLWWTNADGALPEVPRDAYWGWGKGDSLIVVIPSLDIVVSRAGGAWQTTWIPDYSILAPFLNPIVRSVN